MLARLYASEKVRRATPQRNLYRFKYHCFANALYTEAVH